MNRPEKNRMTKQRRMVLEELKRLTSHPTADELYLILRKKLPTISLGTVYRNLDKLSEFGEIRRFDSGSGQWRFDGNTQKHHHIFCVKCGRIGDIFGLTDTVSNEQINQDTDFKILGHQLDFQGICPDCQKKSINC